MKKATVEHLIELPPAILYLDDFRQIVEIAASNSPTWPHITVESHIIESLADLDQLRQATKSNSARRFSIALDDPRMSLSCDGSIAYLSVRSEPVTAEGIAAQWRRVWNHRRLRFAAYGGYASVWVYVFVIALLSAGWFFDRVPAVQVFLGMMMGGAVVYTILNLLKLNLKSKLVLSNRMDSPGFLERNKDKIILAVLSAVAGAVLHWISTRLH